MEGRAERKVPDGKLVRVRAEYDGQRLQDVELTGDFFVDPEDGLDELTAALVGCARDDRDALRTAIEGADARLIGVDTDTVVEAIREAMGDTA